MGNQLVNSMVRGFGMTLGRKAANSVTSRRNQSTPKPVNFSKKQLELIQEYETIKEGVYQILKDTELYYTNGKITEGEYNILKSRANEQLVEADKEIAKLKSVKEPSSLGSSILIFIIGLVTFITVVNLIKN